MCGSGEPGREGFSCFPRLGYAHLPLLSPQILPGWGRFSPLFSICCAKGLPCPVEPGWRICSPFFHSWPMLDQTGPGKPGPVYCALLIHGWHPWNQTCMENQARSEAPSTYKSGLQSACQGLWNQVEEVAIHLPWPWGS